MNIFIDESGIHKQDGKSTTALVYVQVEHLEKLDKAILASEKDLGIEPFHWSKQIWKIRQAFLEAVIREDFEVKIFVFSNPFTQEKLDNALRHLIVEKNIKNITIDGRRTRDYVQHLKRVLREVGIPVKKIRFRNDRAFPCLRLADLFAGLTRAYVGDQQNQYAAKLYKLARIKITIQLMDGQVPPSLF